MPRDKRDYSHASHTLKVLKASGAKYCANRVLLVMCMRSEFDKPEVTITKREIAALTKLERKAVQKGLRMLKEEGSIVPIANLEGGSGNAVTYRLDVVGQGGHGAPVEEGQGPKRRFPASEFSRIHKADGLGAAMDAKRAFEQD